MTDRLMFAIRLRDKPNEATWSNFEAVFSTGSPVSLDDFLALEQETRKEGES